MMKFNKKLYPLAAACFAVVILSGTSLAQQKKSNLQPNLEKAIDVYIAAQAKENEADEYPEARRIVEGDIDGDGDKDAALLYSLEGMGGGNNWAQTVAVFINTNGSYKAVTDIVVGGKLFRSFELESISKGKIAGISETCTDTPQGLCDDPRKETITIIFANNKLKEQKSGGEEL